MHPNVNRVRLRDLAWEEVAHKTMWIIHKQNNLQWLINTVLGDSLQLKYTNLISSNWQIWIISNYQKLAKQYWWIKSQGFRQSLIYINPNFRLSWTCLQFSNPANNHVILGKWLPCALVLSVKGEHLPFTGLLQGQQREGASTWSFVQGAGTAQGSASPLQTSSHFKPSKAETSFLTSNPS